MSLFKNGEFRSSFGNILPWKIDCDALVDEDWETLAALVGPKFHFSSVEGVPTGGLKFAKALQPYCTVGEVLIVDDVLTTGASMERQRAGRDALGVVVFDRAGGTCLRWIIPIWRIFPWFLP